MGLQSLSWFQMLGWRTLKHHFQSFSFTTIGPGVDGQTSWLDPANQSWEELGMDSQESYDVLQLRAQTQILWSRRVEPPARKASAEVRRALTSADCRPRGQGFK